MFEHLPFSTVLTSVGLLMVVVFFVTSADSGALVMDMLCANGQGSKGMGYRIYWSSGAGVVAIVLLLVGGLGALQTMTIASALPFVTALMVAMYGLMKALYIDAQKMEVQQLSLTTPLPAMGSGAWRERLHVIMDFPNHDRVSQFIDSTVHEACQEVCDELQHNGVEAQVSSHKSGNVVLSIPAQQPEDLPFTYKVKMVAYVKPTVSQQYLHAQDAPEEHKYYRAEVHLTQGGQDYDIMAWSKEGVINDIIQQYHTHMHFLHRIR